MEGGREAGRERGREGDVTSNAHRVHVHAASERQL